MDEKNERRRFFRIDDEVALSYRLLTEEEYHDYEGQELGQGQQILTEMENQLSSALQQLHLQSPGVARVMELMNQKLNYLMTHRLGYEDGPVAQVPLREVNLSACGMAFTSRRQMDIQQGLFLEIQLKPSSARLVTLGRVVGVEPVGNGRNNIRVNFTALSEADEDLLIQHLFQVQMRSLKRLRDEEQSLQ